MTNGQKTLVTVPEGGDAEITCAGYRVTINSGVLSVSQGDVKIFPPANGNAPQAQPALTGDPKAPGKDAWLTKEFLASAQQGQKLPDGSAHVRLDDGSHWAVAANVATPRSYGWGNDLGPVGKWVAAQNDNKAHGHADWQIPDSVMGRKLYNLRNEGELKAMFASVRGLWLAEHDSYDAKVQWFDDGLQDDGYRSSGHSVCCARRLDI